MKIDQSPSSIRPPALILLCFPSLLASVTTTLWSLSGHPWSPGVSPNCPAHPLTWPNFTPLPVPFHFILCVEKTNQHLLPLLCVSPSPHYCSTTSLVTLTRASCYSHSSRITKLGDQVRRRWDFSLSLPDNSVPPFWSYSCGPKQIKSLRSRRGVVTKKTKYLYNILAGDKHYRTIKQGKGKTQRW